MAAIGKKEKGCLSSIKVLVMVILLMGIFVDETEAIFGMSCIAYCVKYKNQKGGFWPCYNSNCQGSIPITEFGGATSIDVALSPQEQRAFDDYMDAFGEAPSAQ